MNVKKATNSEQLEMLAKEMSDDTDLARGTPTFGANKASVNSRWEVIGQKLNGIGPPLRTPSEWRKVWTDLRRRTKLKISTNKNSIRQTGGGPYLEMDLTPLEQSVDNITNISVAADPTGMIFGLEMPSPPQNEVSPVSNEKEVPSNTLGKVTPSALNKKTKYTKKRRADESFVKNKREKLVEENTAAVEKLMKSIESLTSAVNYLSSTIEATNWF